MFLSDQVKLKKLADHTAAGTTDVEGASVDMHEEGGFEGVMFMTSFSVAAADNFLKAQQSDDDGVADGWSDLEGTKVLTGASPSNEDVWLDIYRPTKRYVRPVAVVDTSSTVESIWSQRYNPRKLPVDNTTDGTITGEAHVSPDEGTA
jgi:hypothetical protein